jgi:TonB family protein
MPTRFKIEELEITIEVSSKCDKLQLPPLSEKNTISATEFKDLTHIQLNNLREFLSKENTLPLGITLLFICISFFTKVGTPISEKSVPPDKTTTLTFKPSKPMASGSVKNRVSPAPTQAASLKNSPVGIRISQLLGKVSSAEARTKNIVATKSGLSAELGGGRALAMIGKTESSGRNWQGESQNVGTGKIQGGNGSALNAGLNTGRTGKGGIGLIENESEVSGGLDKDVIAQYIKTQLGQILYCYERQLSATPDLFGKISVKFTIAESGNVNTQSILTSSLKNLPVENCVLGKIAKWKFPAPQGGMLVQVTYPFLFKSTN